MLTNVKDKQFNLQRQNLYLILNSKIERKQEQFSRKIMVTDLVSEQSVVH